MCNPITERTPVLHRWTEKWISSVDEDDINLVNNLCRDWIISLSLPRHDGDRQKRDNNPACVSMRRTWALLKLHLMLPGSSWEANAIRNQYGPGTHPKWLWSMSGQRVCYFQMIRVTENIVLAPIMTRFQVCITAFTLLFCLLKVVTKKS